MNEKLIEALKPYLQHQDNCAKFIGVGWLDDDGVEHSGRMESGNPCSCGLEDVLTLLADAAKQEK